MFVDEDLTIDEQIDFYINLYNKTQTREEKLLILEIIKKLNSGDNYEL